ncbi:SH3 domain-containing protein [Oceanomicrobium pacificus]|uniref:SH3 domain-containing protein n=1 Tax=Oceanomicrobium pacificus TaxID=2692916 RepID=A0A6B0THP9_9RHOB|nr:SH3 domain-containing protein [Oceanomicrobium pacificus]MXU63937.1 hypothetical protein [Oceanomicrobium pacificus]
MQGLRIISGRGLALALGLLFAGPVLADDIRTVLLDPASADGVVVLEDAVRGYEITDYLVPLAEGQTLRVTAEAGDPPAYMNLIAPGQKDVAFFIGASEGDSYEGRTDRTGNYKLRLYQMRSAARRGEVAPYTLRLETEGAPPELSEDHLIVAGLSGRLALREAPEKDAPLITRLGAGLTLDSRGCKDEGGQWWCEVALPQDAGISGWASADYLFPAIAPPDMKQDARVEGGPFHATGAVSCGRRRDALSAQCDFGVVRFGDGNGLVSLTLPDGKATGLLFEEGAPAGLVRLDASAPALPPLSVEQQGDLFRVTIGLYAFEIPEAVIRGG